MPAISSDDITEKQLPATPPRAPETVASNVSSNDGYQQSHLGQPGPARHVSTPDSGFGHIHGMSLPNSGSPASVSKDFTVLPPPSVHQPGMAASFPIGMDTTGQIAPPGVKPRLKATQRRGEDSLYFEVEVRGVCVARREDNHMINGTGLLDVAGMTRSRQDHILKSEKVKHVVKTGPLHLQGVWIPYERALDFANKEQITEMLYPLFVHKDDLLLYHLTGLKRNNQAIAADERPLETPSRSKPQTSNSGPALLDQNLEPRHNITLPYPPQSSLTPPPPRGRPRIQGVQYFLTPRVSSIKTSDRRKKRKLEMEEQYEKLLSMNPGLSNVGSMPILPPVSAANDQDKKILPNQPNYLTPERRKVLFNEAPIVESIRERSTRIRSPTSRRETSIEEVHASSNENERLVP